MDEGYDRTFPGDPNPPAKPPKAPPPAPVATEEPAGPTSTPAPAVEPSRPAKAVYHVSADADGRQSIYMMDDKLETTRLGTVTSAPADAEKILHSVGEFNPVTRVWTVPESAVPALRQGRPPFLERIGAQVAGGEAALAMAANAKAVLDGKMTWAQADARNKPELLKEQLAAEGAPSFAWAGHGDSVANLLKHPVDSLVAAVQHPIMALTSTGEYTIDQIAALLPFGAAVAADSAKASVVTGAPMAALAAAQPELAPLVPAAVQAGAVAGSTQSLIAIETGMMAQQMHEAGFDDKTVANWATIGGSLKALWWMVGGKFVAEAPKLLSGLASSKPIISGVAKAAVEAGATGGLMETQDNIRVVLNNMAAEAANNPGAHIDFDKALTSGIEAFTSGASLGGAVGAALAGREAWKLRADNAAEVKAAGDMKTRLAERAKAEEAAAAEPAEPALRVYHGGEAPVTEVDPSKLQSRDSGFYGNGFYVAAAPDATKGYGPVVSAFDVDPAARILSASLRPEDAPPGLVDAVKKWYYDSKIERVKARGKEAAFAAEIEALGKEPLEWKTAVDQYAEANGYDIVKYADGEMVVKNPKVLKPVTEGPAPTAEAPVRGPAAPETPETPAEAEVRAAKPETVVPAVDEVLNTQTRFDKGVREAESKARVDALVSDLADTRTLIKEMTQTRDRFEKAGQSTRLLDKKLSVLLDQEQSIKNDITFYEAAKGQEMVSPTERLSMKPATLESIAKLGFEEGRKDVLDNRRVSILAIAKEHDLTQGDLRTLLRDKNYGTMSDAEFDHWLNNGATKDGEHVPSFRERAVAHAERKAALHELRTAQKEQALKHQDYARRLAEMPPVAKMTTAELRRYADLIKSYEKGDTLLTPERVKALQRTDLAGARSQAEVRGKARQNEAQRRGVPVSEVPLSLFKNVEPTWLDKFMPDPVLARKDPILGMAVGRTKELQIRAEMAAREMTDHFHDLAAKAAKERAKKEGVGARVANWVLPQQKELMAFMEEADPAKKAALGAGLTPAELQYATEVEAFFDRVREYLFETGELTSSRFEGHYVPHVSRSILEMVRDIPDKGVKSAFKELVERVKRPTGGIADEVSRALGMTKSFDATEFRSGKLTPSRNLFAVVDHYVNQFYNKVALDEAVPFVDTVVKAFAAMEKAPEAEQLIKTITAFTTEYLNAKKGDARWMWDKGTLPEAAVRFGMSLVSMKYIAVNFALQAMSPIGEATGAFMALGNRGIAKAVARRWTKEGQAILYKYRGWIGEGPIEGFNPGSDAGDAAKFVMYGAFKTIRHEILKDVLIGSLTPEELKTGVVSEARLAQIRLEAGRWIDVHGNKSIRGQSVMGSQWTQFKGWAIPPALSTGEALLKLVSGKATKETVRDAYHLAQLGLAAALFRSWATEEDSKDDSFAGRAARYARGEVLSMFSGPKTLAGMAAGGIVMTELAKFANNLILLGELERYQSGEKEGELKGWDGLQRQFTPAIVKQFMPKEEK